MNDGFEMEAIRLRGVNGRLKVGVLSPDGTGSSGEASDWGSLYAVCHVTGGGGGIELLSDRMEGIAQETYHRAPGGVTNRLRQALRNANRYLYLRNTVRGELQRLLAAMGCVATRGMDAYACGVGPHATFIVGRGRVGSFASRVQASALSLCEDWSDGNHMLGGRAVVSDPKFCYRQLLPGDRVLIIAADEVGLLRHAGDTLAAIGDDKEIKAAAQHAAKLFGKLGNFSALLMQVGSDTAGLHQEVRGSRPGVARRLPSATQALIPSHRLARDAEASEDQRPPRRNSLNPWGQLGTSRGETPVAQRLGSRFSEGLGKRRAGTRRVKGVRVHQFAKQAVEICRLAGALVLSLILGLWRGSLGLLRSTWRLLSRIWTWIRQNRVLERLGRACSLALLGVWAGSKGLLIRILPERQGSTTTYGDSVQPMARAKVVGFHPSRRSRAAIGALIVLAVFVVVAASALRINSRLKQADVETLMAQAEETMLLAERQESEEERIALLLEAEDTISLGTAIQADNTRLGELSERLERELDAATGGVRIPFDLGEMLTIAEGSPRRIVIHADGLYVLDESGRHLYRYSLGEEGKPVADQEPWIWELEGEADAASLERVVDIEWVDAANGRLTPALLMLMVDGSLLELNSAGRVRDVSISDAVSWENPRAVRTYHGSLYVLDPGRGNILKYTPTGDNYEYPPANYLQESGDIDWADVVDMAIGDSVYLMLSNGSIRKFAAGAPKTFMQEGLYPPLKNPVAMFASTDSLSVYVAEPDEGRIVEFSRAGQFIRQFRVVNDAENLFKALRAFAVDSRNDRLFVGTEAGIYSARLPSLQ